MNKEQTTLLIQILDNQISDYDKAISEMETKIGATVPGSMRIMDRKSRRKKIEELRVAIINLEVDIRLKQAEVQLTDLYHSDRADTLEEIVSGMNLTKDELAKLRGLIPVIIGDLEQRHGDIETIIENWEQFNK